MGRVRARLNDHHLAPGDELKRLHGLFARQMPKFWVFKYYYDTVMWWLSVFKYAVLLS